LARAVVAASSRACRASTWPGHMLKSRGLPQVGLSPLSRFVHALCFGWARTKPLRPRKALPSPLPAATLQAPTNCAVTPLPSFNLQEYSLVLTAWQFGHCRWQSVLRRPPSPARRRGGRQLLRRPGHAHLQHRVDPLVPHEHSPAPLRRSSGRRSWPLRRPGYGCSGCNLSRVICAKEGHMCNF
jgi:hypothetical protein